MEILLFPETSMGILRITEEMAYQIKYRYQTGDSYGSEELEAILEFEWENIKVAKANLDRIEEHYKYYKALKGYGFPQKTRDELYKDNKHFDWFVDTKDLHQYCLKVYTDGGSEIQFSAPWCGHFESLIWAEVITKEMKFYA